MKHLLLLATVLFLSVSGVLAQQDAITKYFDKYVDDERFSMVYVSPKLFEMVSKVDLESEDIDPDILEMVKELKGLRILSYDGEGARKFYDEANNKIDFNQYESLIEARGDTENVRIMAITEGDNVQELLLLVGGDTEFALISFVGNIDLKKIGKLGAIMNIDGVEHLQELDKG